MSDDRHKIVAIRNILNNPNIHNKREFFEVLGKIRNIIDKDTLEYDKIDAHKGLEDVLALLIHLSTSQLTDFETKAWLRTIINVLRLQFTEVQWALLISTARSRLGKNSPLLHSLSISIDKIFSYIDGIIARKLSNEQEQDNG